MTRVPCKGCGERNPGCHDKCEKYLSYREEIEKEKQARADYYLARGGFTPTKYYGHKYKHSN